MAQQKSQHISEQISRHPACQFQSDKMWLDLIQRPDGTIVKPDELEKHMEDPPNDIDDDIFDRIYGSMLGMALGDALGAHVEFRPHQYMVENPVTNLEGGGTWGLKKGQFTDDTSMALCLANSLIVRGAYVPYDQLVRYKWWYRNGYMSSTGKCFDIGAATKNSLVEFQNRQKNFSKKYEIPLDQLDYLADPDLLKNFDVNCSSEGVAGNGALMRLTPVPLFFYQYPKQAVKYSGLSGRITHGDDKAFDACRYYGALIVAAVNGATKEELLDRDFYKNHEPWFGNKVLHPDIINIAQGSYRRKGGYAKGIRGKGYIVSALEAALWAFWSDEDSFEKGVLAAVNLGDDTDTTAAIYGQLAGAHYGYEKLPKRWTEQIYAKDFIQCLSKWIAYEGKYWSANKASSSTGIVYPVLGSRTSQRRSSVVDSSTLQKSLDSREGPLAARPRSHHHTNLTVSSELSYYLQELVTADDVSKLLRLLGREYASYAKTFKKNHIDGFWFLNHIDDDNLIKHGVDNEDHRQVILAKIEELREKCRKNFSKPQN